MKHQARKRFGQNFLQDQTVINRIIDTIHPQDSDRLIEIGPGLGALTYPLLERLGKLEVVEIDRDLIAKLKARSELYGKLTLHEGDALKFDFAQCYDGQHKLRIIGNLPYNISTPIMFHLLSYAPLIQDMHFLLQKEVVDRLAAKPGCSAYGRLTVMAQYYCAISNLFTVANTAFDPQPKVQSAIVCLVPHQTLPFQATCFEDFKVLVTAAFNQRRKTIRNSLKKLLTAEQIEHCGVVATTRPEQISIQQYVQLANYYSAQNHGTGDKNIQ